MTTIRFTATPYLLKNRLILRLPEKASKQLSSRSQVAVNGEFNEHKFSTVLEPDGEFGHWMNVTNMMCQAGAEVGEELSISIAQTNDWPEVIVPKDLVKALEVASQKVKDKWLDITPMARWEWVRWISSTKNPDTRNIRIEKTISKLDGKHRRPCCFNLAACTDMELAKNSRLISE